MKIPLYDSRLTPVVVTPSPKSGASPIGEAIQSVGSILGQVSESLLNAERLRQISSADQEYTQGKNAIIEKADQDQVLDGFNKRYKDEITTLNKTILDKITDPQAKTAYERILGKNSLNLEFKIRNLNTKKVNDANVATMNSGIEADKEEYYSEPDPKKKQEIADSIAARIKSNSDAGTITREYAQKRFTQEMIALKEGQFNYDLGVDPDATLLRVQQNYYTKDPKVKRQFENTAKNELVRLQEQAEIQKEENRLNAVMDVVNDIVNGESVYEKVKGLQGVIDPKDELLFTQPPVEEEDATKRAKAFVNLYQMYVEDDSLEQASNLLMGAVKSYVEKGGINQEELGYIFDTTKTFMEQWRNPPKGFWKTIINWQKNLFLDRKEKAEAVINTFNRALQLLKGGKSESEAAQEAIEEGKVLMNPNMTKYKIGDVIVRGGRSFEVKGYDEIDGEPILDER